jgi:L-seryl-tRNA(Ser) seleniumtransferase
MASNAKQELLRKIPSIADLLAGEAVSAWLADHPRGLVTDCLRAAVDHLREQILADEAGRCGARHVTPQFVLTLARARLDDRTKPHLRAAVNATGIILHTALGRAVWPESVVDSLAEDLKGSVTLAIDRETGLRSDRDQRVEYILTELTGAEAATVVNNNAAATLLILRTFAASREVVVSRGQLIEIGGSFRLPDIMRASGASLHEVGTTNRTRIADYEGAINENTAMLLRAHPSNYRIVGFTEEVSIEAIATLAHKHDLIAVDDLGSGALVDLTPYGLPEEPCVHDSLAAGADLVCFSGDKLLGGPQAGLIVGRKSLIKQLDVGPLMRTYRVDKMTLIALEATLRCHLDPEHAVANVPALAMLSTSPEELAKRARTLSQRLEAALPDEQFYVCSDVGYAGGGSMPGRELQTVVVQWRPGQASTEAMAAALRDADMPIIVRIRDDAICFDLRTIREADFETLVGSVSAAVWGQQADRSPED